MCDHTPHAADRWSQKSFADDLWTCRPLVLRSLRSVETYPLTSRKFLLAFRTAYAYPFIHICTVYCNRNCVQEKNVGLQSQNHRIRRTSTVFFLISVIFCARWDKICLLQCVDLLIDVIDRMVWLLRIDYWGGFDWCFIFICTARCFNRF